MTNAISSATAVTPVTDTQVSGAVAQSSASSSSQSASATATTSSTTANSSSGSSSATTISPRLVYNAIAGVVVTEFLSQSGAIDVQLPSKAAIAYLQAGLTQQGLPRQTSSDGSQVSA